MAGLIPPVNVRTLYVEVYRNPERHGFFDKWIASWRSVDDPTHYADENCVGSFGPTSVTGWSRAKALANARAELQRRVLVKLDSLRRDRDAEESFERVKIEIDMTPLAELDE